MRTAILAVLILACALPASAAEPSAGVIRITATYPGADARTVDETVLIPLYKQISGVEGMIRIESEARNDGTGTVTVYFEPKTDLNLAQVEVQNRVSLALQVIPAPCRELGIHVRKFPIGPPAFWLALTSVDEKHDAAFLENYATVYLKDVLARVPGVADVRVVGGGELAVLVRVNPDRLRAYKLMASDVVDALRRQNAQIAGGGTVGGRGWGLLRPVTASGRITKIDQFGDVILKANPNGEVLRVRDVAQVELAAQARGLSSSELARVNGKPAALIAVTSWPGRVTADKLLKIEDFVDLPPGMRLEVVVDRARDRLLEIELRLPDATPVERTEAIVERAMELIHGLAEKPGTVAFAQGRTTNAVTIFVKLPAKGGPTAADVKKALAVVPDAAIRVGSVQPGGEAFPVRLALTEQVWDQGEEALPEVANRVVAALLKGPGVTGPATFPGPFVPHYATNIDRDKCAMLGVELDNVLTTLQANLGGVHATNFSKYGRTLRVMVQSAPEFARQIDDLAMLFVRSSAGEMVPLEKLVKIRKALSPSAVVRVNGYRAVIATAASAADQTPAEAAARCVKLAQEILPRGYRVKDLTDPSR